MNKLTNTGSLPALQPDPELSATVANLVCVKPADPRGRVTIVASLAPALLARINRRVADLEAALAHRDRRAVDRTVAALLVAFPSRATDANQADVVAAGYAFPLADVSSLAVEVAARMFIAGTVPGANRGFRPSTAQLCAEATAVAGTWRRELLDLQRVLAAEVRETIRPTSRERTSEIQASVLEATARAGLADKLSALGLDPAELDKIPDAPPRPNSFERATGTRPRGAGENFKNLRFGTGGIAKFLCARVSENFFSSGDGHQELRRGRGWRHPHDSKNAAKFRWGGVTGCRSLSRVRDEQASSYSW